MENVEVDGTLADGVSTLSATERRMWTLNAVLRRTIFPGILLAVILIAGGQMLGRSVPGGYVTICIAAVLGVAGVNMLRRLTGNERN